ncbi:MAG: hypothetical protein ACREQP_09775, partial [Candidatus Binatia bacterium]
SLCVAVVVYFCGANILYQSLAPLILIILSFLPFKFGNVGMPGKERLQSLDDSHRTLLGIFLLVAAFALAAPYASFGQATAKGMAFNELHKTDLLHHMVTMIELQKGVPPQNPYFSGEPLHYFWLAHVLPSFAWSFSGRGIEPRDVIVLTGLSYSLLFTGTLFLALRRLFSDASILLWLMVIVAAAYGYNSIYLAARWITEYVAPETLSQGGLVQKLFVDDWGQQYTGYSHGWFRSFLVEPHTTLALAAVFSAIAVSRHHGFFPNTLFPAIVQATLLAFSLAMDSFLGMLVVLSYGFYGLFQFARFKFKGADIWNSLIITSAIAILIVAFMFFAEMVSFGHRSLAFVPYTAMIVFSPLVFVIDYGPMFFLGGIGLFLALRRQCADDYGFFIVLCFVALFFMFFIRYPDVGTQIARKSGTALRIALVVFSGLALRELLFRPNGDVYKYALIGFVALAVPTLIADIWRISTFDKKEEKTYYVNRQDYDAYLWMRQNTSPSDLIQDLPSGISNIPAFAQRRTALGDWVHAENYQVGTQRVRSRHKEIFRTLFQGHDIDNAIRVMDQYNIRYLYMGTEAAGALSAQAREKFAFVPNQFKKVYAQNGVALYCFEDKVSVTEMCR